MPQTGSNVILFSNRTVHYAETAENDDKSIRITHEDWVGGTFQVREMG